MLGDWGRACFYLALPPIVLFQAAMELLARGMWWNAALLLGCVLVVVRSAVLIAASIAAGYLLRMPA